MNPKRCLLWFNKDLRTHDNPMINWAVENNYEVVAVSFLPKNKAPIALSFIFQSIQDLKNQFAEKNIPFSILDSSPEIQIASFVERNSIDLVLTQKSYNSRDQLSLQKLEDRIGKKRILSFRYQTLIDIEQLPFKIEEMPLVFTAFRKMIEKTVVFKDPLPSRFETLRGFRPVAEFEDLNPFNNKQSDSHTFPFDLSPGETGAKARLKEYFWETQSLLHYKETRNGLLHKNESSKMSPYLALGCLSPRRLYEEIKNFEHKYEKNESTDWFIQELLWRDYFKFTALNFGTKLISPQGLHKQTKIWNRDPQVFQKWQDGQSGVPFVDANMTELNLTGWMSNRGRQNVASYLAKTLKIDWTLGAQYFEQNLIDDDTENNWGNWQYLAGVGTDPRDRIFNIQRQAEMYDPRSEYQQKWLTKTASFHTR
jgi:deoxyribodipyrimidine photo-lyase